MSGNNNTGIFGRDDKESNNDIKADVRGHVHTVAGSLALVIAYDVNSDPEYIGYAKTGTATSVAEWRIKKITYVSRNPTAIEWADGDDYFDNIWDNYAGLSYS